jgi:hypothetical protein
MRLIDADALLDAMRDEEFPSWHPLDEIDSVIDKAPTIDAEPVRHGRWIDDDTPSFFRRRKCSVCGSYDGKNTAVYGHYCWHCGAKMDGGAKDDGA